MVEKFGSELSILLGLDLKKLENFVDPKIIEGLRRVRAGELEIKPGFDGQYGTVNIFKDGETKKQIELFF